MFLWVETSKKGQKKLLVRPRKKGALLDVVD